MISGTLSLPADLVAAGLSRATVCGAPNSRMTVTTKRGATTLSTRRVALRSDCSYSTRVSFSSTRRFGRARSLRFVTRFSGNRFLATRSGPTTTIRLAGR